MKWDLHMHSENPTSEILLPTFPSFGSQLSFKSMPRGCLVNCWPANLVKTRLLRETLYHHFSHGGAQGASSVELDASATHNKPTFNVYADPIATRPRSTRCYVVPSPLFPRGLFPWLCIIAAFFLAVAACGMLFRRVGEFLLYAAVRATKNS